MPRSLRGVVLAGTLVLAGCGLGGQEARDPVEPSPITKAQLAAMVLPHDELGTIAEGMKPLDDSGPVANEEAADDTLDPTDTARSVRSAGRLGGHKSYYGNGGLAALKRKQGVVSVGTEIELLEDTVYAAQYLHKQLGDFQRFQGKQDDGSTLGHVSSFTVDAVGDEAEGLLATSTLGKQAVYVTAVAFRRERIIGVATVVRADQDDAQSEARALAVKLDSRIQAVLDGDIEVGPPEPEEETTDGTAALADHLPERTLQPEDVGHGAAAAGEGPVEERSYVGYQRTFEDVAVGGSHLMRLQARTAVYAQPGQAAIALRLVGQSAGRESFADGIARAFAKETGVTPTDIHVRSFSTGVRGMPGLVATFELVGAKFEMASIFVRSGRYVQSVTGICRPDEVSPGDLTVLARRAQARLVA